MRKSLVLLPDYYIFSNEDSVPDEIPALEYGDPQPDDDHRHCQK